MPELNKIKKILKQDKPKLIKKYNIKNIGIFGSYIRGEQNKKSDIDILVEFEKPIGLFKFFELEDYLQSILKVKVDLVSKKSLKPFIGEHILREVVIL